MAIFVSVNQRIVTPSGRCPLSVPACACLWQHVTLCGNACEVCKNANCYRIYVRALAMSVETQASINLRLYTCLLVSTCMSVWLSVRCLSVCLSVRLSVCLLFVRLSVRLSVCLSVCPSVCPSVCVFVRLSICLSVGRSVCLSFSVALLSPPACFCPYGLYVRSQFDSWDSTKE